MVRFSALKSAHMGVLGVVEAISYVSRVRSSFPTVSDVTPVFCFSFLVSLCSVCHLQYLHMFGYIQLSKTHTCFTRSILYTSVVNMGMENHINHLFKWILQWDAMGSF